MRLRPPALLVLLSVSAITPSLSCSEGRDQPPNPKAAQPQVRAFHAKADEGRKPIFERDGLTLRASCETFGTDTGPYLSLTAETSEPNAAARVAFRTTRAGDPERYHFEQEDFGPSYGKWDLLGAESGRVRGKLNFLSPEGEGITVRFSGSGGSADAECTLRSRLENEPAVDVSSRAARVEDLPKWTPRPIRLGPGQGEFDTCKIKAGGYDVWIKDIPCRQARKWIIRLLPAYGEGPYHREGVGRLEGSWECWSRLEGRYGPIHNVCARGEQLILFYFA